jgi:hypothetical protein
LNPKRLGLFQIVVLVTSMLFIESIGNLRWPRGLMRVQTCRLFYWSLLVCIGVSWRIALIRHLSIYCRWVQFVLWNLVLSMDTMLSRLVTGLSWHTESIKFRQTFLLVTTVIVLLQLRYYVLDSSFIFPFWIAFALVIFVLSLSHIVF